VPLLRSRHAPCARCVYNVCIYMPDTKGLRLALVCISLMVTNSDTVTTTRTINQDKALAESCQSLARKQGIKRGVGRLILFLMKRGHAHYNRACAFARKSRRTAALRSLTRRTCRASGRVFGMRIAQRSRTP